MLSKVETESRWLVEDLSRIFEGLRSYWLTRSDYIQDMESIKGLEKKFNTFYFVSRDPED